MNLPVVNGIIGLFDKGLDIIDQAVEDKDKKIEAQRRMMELMVNFSASIQTSEHVPGYVKFMYALRDVIIPLLRPVGSALMSAAGVYIAAKGIQIDPVTHGMITAAFPGWMASRHVNKQTAKKIEAAAAPRRMILEQARGSDNGREAKPAPVVESAFPLDRFDYDG